MQGGGQLAFRALGMVDVVLHKGIGGVHFIQNVQRLVRAVQVEAGNVEGIDGLDQQAQLGHLERRCGKAQVVHQGAAQGGGIHASGRLAHQAVELGHAQRVGIGHRLGHASAELVYPAGVAGDAALARIPVARRQVVQNNLQAGGIEPLLDLFDGMGVRKQKLHGLKAGLGGALKAIEKRHFGKQHAEVGSKTGHGVSPIKKGTINPAAQGRLGHRPCRPPGFQTRRRCRSRCPWRYWLPAPECIR